MPKAAVDEHGDSCRAEHEVGGASQLWERSRCDAVPQSAPVDGGSNTQLGPRVPAAVADHRTPDGLAARPRVGWRH